MITSDSQKQNLQISPIRNSTSIIKPKNLYLKVKPQNYKKFYQLFGFH
jgi:hypothetical protein